MPKASLIIRVLLACLIALTASACAVNAVTGERNFQVYGSDWEQEVGQQMYAPMKQSQGGDFILDPELNSYLNEVGSRLAQQARRKDEFQFEFSIINSSIPNAWALPGGKIVVNRGLLTQLHSEAELAAVLGHEIVHADAAHAARQQSKGMLAQVGAVATMVVLGSSVNDPTAREMAMMVPALGMQLIMQRYGRDAEREADEYGMLYMSEAGYNPEGAVELQQTFIALSDKKSEDWLSGLFASHPPSTERLENNRETAAELPQGGETNEQGYQQKTAFLRRLEPAYAAYDEANTALKADQLDEAQAKISEALRMEPREALFHALQGDIYRQQNQSSRALASYQKAVKANGDLFYGYLRKGQVEYALERYDPARSSLNKSLELLPTADAHFFLGLMDKRTGDREAAVAHFQQAAQSSSEAGKDAQRELVLLDLADNPSAYIATRPAMDSSNQVWVQLGNQTSVAMKNILINVTWLDDQGQTRRSQKLIKGPLAGGEQTQEQLGIELSGVQQLSSRVRLEVSAAEVDR